jgi:hypothetical protein
MEPEVACVGRDLDPPSVANREDDFSEGSPHRSSPADRTSATANMSPRDHTGVSGQQLSTRWSAPQVGAWVQSRGIPSEVAQLFVAHEIEGTDLLAMTKDDLREIGVAKMGHLMKLVAGISELRQEAITPYTQRWATLLVSDGPQRVAALQAVVDGWRAGRWVLEQQPLGHGGSGAVFCSTDSHHAPERVAMKFIYQQDHNSGEREAALLQLIQHDHVCKLYEHHVSADGLLCGMVLELLAA